MNWCVGSGKIVSWLLYQASTLLLHTVCFCWLCEVYVAVRINSRLTAHDVELMLCSSQLMCMLVTVVMCMLVTVQTHEGNQAVQQERETWQRENATLRAELEQFKRGGLVAASSPVSVVGRSSPLDQHVKSASPNSDDDDLEMSMIKVWQREGNIVLVIYNICTQL